MPQIYAVLDLESYGFYTCDSASARAGYGFRDTLGWDICCLGFRVVLLLYLRLGFGARRRWVLRIRLPRARAGTGLRDTLAWDIRCIGFRVVLLLYLLLRFGARRLWV